MLLFNIPEQAPDGPAATVPGLARQTETDHWPLLAGFPQESPLTESWRRIPNAGTL